MNAKELFHEDYKNYFMKTTGVYYCGECRSVSRNKENAETCCEKSKCEKAAKRFASKIKGEGKVSDEHKIFTACFNASISKSLVIVGGGWDGRDDLSAYDHVCWVNAHYKKGMRVDSIFSQTSILPPADLPKLSIVAYQIGGEYERTWRQREAYVHIPFSSQAHKHLHPQGLVSELFASLSRKLNTSVLMGIKTVHWWSLFPWRSIHITGFDFYKSHYGVIPYSVGPHVFGPQIDWLTELVRSDKRFTASPALDAILPQRNRTLRLIKVLRQDKERGVVWEVEEHELATVTAEPIGEDI